MEAVYVVNPLTKRKVMVGSQLYRRLVAKQVIVPEGHGVVEIQRAVNRMQKPCPEGMIRNPESMRCISKKGALYKKLLAKGVKFHDADSPHMPALIANPPPVVVPKKNHQCKNHSTFLYQNEIEDVEDDDLLMLPSGYCYSIEEILEWIRSGSFNNVDPYLEGKILFSSGNKEVWEKNKGLADALSAFFANEQKKREHVYDILKDHMDMLYLLADTGRICLFDNISSHEVNNSGEFEYSIHALAHFQEKLHQLPKHVKDAFEGLKLNTMTVADTLHSANNGTLCIHGVGWNLVKVFIATFLRMEQMFKIRYDPLKTGLYFIEEKKYILTIYNKELRLTFDIKSHYYVTFYRETLMTIPNKSSLVWSKTKLKKDGLASIYTKECPNDAFLSSLDSSDEWFEIPEWRKVRLEDGYCFDLLFLIKTITMQLNTAKNVNPYPMYPSNIFTNKPLSQKDLIQLRRRIVNNYINVSPCLLMFFFNEEKVWSNDDEYIRSSKWQDACISLFERDLRYRRYLYQRTDEVTIHGMWVRKNEAVSPHENQILNYLATAEEDYLRGLTAFSVPNEYFFVDKKTNYLSGLVHAYHDLKDIQPMRG